MDQVLPRGTKPGDWVKVRYRKVGIEGLKTFEGRLTEVVLDAPRPYLHLNDAGRHAALALDRIVKLTKPRAKNRDGVRP